MVARLESQISYLKKCDSIGEFLIDDLDALAKQTPAAYVAYQNGRYDHKTSGVQDRHMTLSVIAVARSFRSQKAARAGRGTSEKGAYDVLEDVRAALSDQACDLDIDPLIPVRDGMIAGTQSIAIYAIDFETRCRDTV